MGKTFQGNTLAQWGDMLNRQWLAARLRDEHAWHDFESDRDTDEPWLTVWLVLEDGDAQVYSGSGATFDLAPDAFVAYLREDTESFLDQADGMLGEVFTFLRGVTAGGGQ